MNALGKVEKLPATTFVGTGLLIGSAVALTAWSSRGAKPRDPMLYVGGVALAAAAGVALYEKARSKPRTDPTVPDKSQLVGQPPFCNYTVWKTHVYDDSEALMEVIRVPGPRKSPAEEQALINWVYFKYPPSPAYKHLLMVHCWDGTKGTDVELLKW